jgi:futalosine hydrolase
VRVLVICAVSREARAVAGLSNASVVLSGVGRTNAAMATTRALIEDGPFDAVLSLGIAGALPCDDCSLKTGEIILGNESVYHEEGLLSPESFMDTSEMGFPLGQFKGNRIPADPELLRRLKGLGRNGVIATVATCSGTDAGACEVTDRTGALAEAMEGAAVLHVASAFSCPAIELRVISNTTGDRERQIWALDEAFIILQDLVPELEKRLQGR